MSKMDPINYTWICIFLTNKMLNKIHKKLYLLELKFDKSLCKGQGLLLWYLKTFSKRIILGKINWRRTNVVQDLNSGNEFGHKICSKYQDIFYKLLSCLVRMFNVQTIDIFWDDMSLIWKKCMQLFDDIFASCISH